jgi:hypothetical protein
MKERRILFSGPMVRAILSGRKTQTRRVVKPIFDVARVTYGCIGGQGFGFIFGNKVVRCPFGEIGDRMWVRETHAPMLGGGWVYAADYSAERLKQKDGKGFWKPSIFMRREASRISLEIVSVRVERLQDISEADAIAEGIEPVQMPTGEVMYDDYLEPGAMMARPVSSYATLWDRINGAGAWSTNPWVWVVKFKKL